MYNEKLLSDGVLDARDDCPDMQGYRSITFKQIPKRKITPYGIVPPREISEDYSGPNEKYLLISAADDYCFVVKKKYATYCSKTIKWILSNPYGYLGGKKMRNNFLSFTYIEPRFLFYVSLYFNWKYYYGARNFTKTPPPFKVPKSDIYKLQAVANFLGC